MKDVFVERRSGAIRARGLRPLLGRARRYMVGKCPPIVRVHLSQYVARLKLASRKKPIGAHTYIDRTAQVLGWDHVSIGHHSAISENCWLNVNRRVSGQCHIVIGNFVYLGRRNFLTAGREIVIGDYCMTGVDCKLLGADHMIDSPLAPYVVSEVSNDKTIRLGVNARLGAGVLVIGNVTIGHGSVIGAGTLVTKDIPPFSIAFGSPCRVYKRFDFVASCWVEADAYHEESGAAMPDEASYRAMLKAKYPDLQIPMQAAGGSFGDMP